MICHNEKSILRNKINNFICCKYWLKKPTKDCPEKIPVIEVIRGKKQLFD